MNIITLSTSGITTNVSVLSVHGVFMLTHGQDGRGRWQVRFPIHVRAFGLDTRDVTVTQIAQIITDTEITLTRTGRKDREGNDVLLIRPGQADDKQMVLWNLSPGYRGGATYEMRGDARLLAEGYEAQGAAGRMGGAPCPIVEVGPGPALLTWRRTGRLYGDPSCWAALYRPGNRWYIVDRDTLEAAVLTRTVPELEIIRDYLA